MHFISLIGIQEKKTRIMMNTMRLNEIVEWGEIFYCN